MLKISLAVLALIVTLGIYVRWNRDQLPVAGTAVLIPEACAALRAADPKLIIADKPGNECQVTVLEVSFGRVLLPGKVEVPQQQVRLIKWD